MKSNFFNTNTKNAKYLLCIILFLFGMVLITSPAYTETSKADDADTEVSKKTKGKADESDKPGKADKPKKSDKNAAEDFGDGEGDTDDKPGKKASQDDEVEDEHPVIPELENETYVELARIGKLDEKQQKKLVIIQKKRGMALDHWDKTNEKKLDRMRRKAAGEEKESRRTKLEAKVDKHLLKRDKLAAKYDIAARKVCKSPQLINYNTKILYRYAMDEFSDVQLQLSDEEALKVKKACAGLVKKKYRSPVVDLNRDKKIRSKGVYLLAKKALTRKQLKRYKRAKMQEEREKQESTKKNRRRNR